MADNFRPEDEVQGQVSTEPSEMQQFIEAYMADHPHASPLDAIAAYQCQQESTPQALKARIQKNLSKPICGMRMGAAIDPRSGPTTADSGELDQGLLASFPKLTRARRKEVAVMPYWEDQQAALYLLDREFPRAWDHQGLNSFNSIVRCPATCPEIADSLEWVERMLSSLRYPQDLFYLFFI